MRGHVRQGSVGQRHSTLTRRALCALIFIIAGGTTLWAQEPVPVPVSSVVSPAAETGARQVRLLVGRSTVLDIGTEIARVSLTSADIADALVTSPSQLLINGKLPGTISMFVIAAAGGRVARRETVCETSTLRRVLCQWPRLFPGVRPWCFWRLLRR